MRPWRWRPLAGCRRSWPFNQRIGLVLLLVGTVGLVAFVIYNANMLMPTKKLSVEDIKAAWTDAEQREALKNSSEFKTWFGQQATIGSVAPDFDLLEQRSGARFHLSEACKDRPVVLVFGNFSCDVMCAHFEELRQLVSAYAERARFVFVQIEGAGHPLPTGLSKAFESAEIGQASAGNLVPRLLSGLDYYGLKIAALMDSRDRAVEKAYDAWPSRIVIVGRDGRIALDPGRMLTRATLTAVGDWLARHTGVQRTASRERSKARDVSLTPGTTPLVRAPN